MIVDKRGIVVSMGYNGFPIGCSDDEVGEVACLASSGKRSQLQSLSSSILLLPVLLSPPPIFFFFYFWVACDITTASLGQVCR